MKFFWIGMISLVSVLGVASTCAYADETGTSAAGTAPVASETQAPKKISKKKVKAPREKETEGTEAPNRFEADTVIKSQYQFDGKQLEVDPD